MTEFRAEPIRSFDDLLPIPTATDHKYTRGVCGLVTGSDQYPGVALLSTAGALNTGVGMVRFAATGAVSTLVTLQHPEVVCFTADVTEAHVQSWVIGSGATGEYRAQQIQAVLALDTPMVVDAAALTPAAQRVADGGILGAHTILTPHSGELADFLTWIQALAPHLLLGESAPPTRENIEENPQHWAELAARLSGATVLLKGARNVISSPEGHTITHESAAHYLASAGSGDVLAGILGGVLAQAVANYPEKLKKDDSLYAHLAALACSIHTRAALSLHQGYGPTRASAVAHAVTAVIAEIHRERGNRL
ncbi:MULTISPECIES: ADP/ATP-dependent (S)-NAD(P)H-hydrate dehydratase [unclassified Rothia (in: high G+C Gram-positive bacteria)]|uniref:ADP-dependent NAD(P)H-hydrate dehydratase n=1 Tax=unclassified Rothia (in: high G+C Gram-positive bacteria) TaxID=2689056 RepID=UPI00195A7216|nr:MULTISPECIES: ADP/ATP-dependent (S)-NAD(P)H-hydrate dehydratase [unclassified Rothia (in: high G+C Gram-positive bacteria)]MBM7051188.1 NAD(P)H-hydrate dehydratase [Rothia sp. ZJ1223]QRZ62116.1 NAD(P)H-hydrate dehydratase [Rothia sp. ZJ932]